MRGSYSYTPALADKNRSPICLNRPHHRSEANFLELFHCGVLLESNFDPSHSSRINTLRAGRCRIVVPINRRSRKLSVLLMNSTASPLFIVQTFTLILPLGTKTPSSRSRNSTSDDNQSSTTRHSKSRRSQA